MQHYYMKQKQITKTKNNEQKEVIGLDIGNSEIRVAYKNKEISLRSTLFIQNSNIYVNKRANYQCLIDSIMLMQHKFEDQRFQSLVKYYNCQFSEGANKNVLVRFQNLTFIQQFHFQFAIALIIKGLFLTNTSLRYVITQKPIKIIATVFTGKINPYRLGLKSCLKLAGIQDCSFVSSSACVAANYLKTNQKSRDDTEIVGVIDFGSQGLTFNCYKFYHMQTGIVENLVEETRLCGGTKLTNILADYMVHKLIKDKGMDIRKNPLLMHKLRLLCQQAKCVLSSNQMAFVRLDGLPDILMYGRQISVYQFEQCIEKQIIQNLAIIKKGLKFLKQRPKKFILTGRSCKIPLFKKLLLSIIKKDEIVQADQDDLRRGMLIIKSSSMHLVEICQFQLRVEGDQKLSQILVQKGENVPLRKKVPLKFPSGQLTYSLKFFQNNQLVATGFLPQRPRENNFNLYVEIDHDKMLNIYATTSQGLIKMNIDMMELPKEEYIKYQELMAKVDFHIQND